MNPFTQETLGKRRKLAEYEVLDVILQRSSPRSMSGEPLRDERLMRLFEAGRWAPSSYNRQPWSFVYSTPQLISWEGFFGVLSPGNKHWCHNASALVVMVSTQRDPHDASKIFKTASFDCGAAWENICLQGVYDGLVVHGMEGFDMERARHLVKAGPHHKVEMMLAVGLPADRHMLPPELQESEKVSDRRPLKSLVYKGSLKEAGHEKT